MLHHQIGGKMIFLRLKVLNSIPSLLPGLSQIISDPTHILPNSSSCIDLIFTNQPNLVTESGVHPSLHSKCHHQIVFAKLNLKVEYPSLYECLILDYKNADVPSINHSIDVFD